MKNLLTLTLFVAAMFIAGSLNAQERTAKKGTAANDTVKVKAKQDTTKVKKEKKKTDGKVEKKEDKVGGGGSGTDRMAIDELGMPVEKKDKKKSTTKSNTNTTGTKQE